MTAAGAPDGSAALRPAVLLLGDEHLSDVSDVGQQQLGPRLRDRGAVVASLAVDGLTAASALHEYADLVWSPNAWCIVSLGMHDAATETFDVRTFQRHYARLLRWMSATRLLLLGPSPLPAPPGAGGVTHREPEGDGGAGTVARTTTQRLLDVTGVVAGLAAEAGAAHLSLRDLLIPGRHLQPDGWHLNADAYDLLADETWRIITQASATGSA